MILLWCFCIVIGASGNSACYCMENSCMKILSKVPFCVTQKTSYRFKPMMMSKWFFIIVYFWLNYSFKHWFTVIKAWFSSLNPLTSSRLSVLGCVSFSAGMWLVKGDEGLFPPFVLSSNLNGFLPSSGGHNARMYETDYCCPPQSSLPEKPHSKKRKSKWARGKERTKEGVKETDWRHPKFPLSLAHGWVTGPHPETNL